MPSVTALPPALQELIQTAYCDALRARTERHSLLVMLDHVRMLCQTDVKSDTLLDWMAHMLQFPHSKPQRGFVLVGPPRCGKTCFANLVALLLGQNSVWQSTTLRPRSNELLLDATLVILTDCNVSEELVRINSLISDQTITHDQDSIVAPSFHRVLVTTTVFPPLCSIIPSPSSGASPSSLAAPSTATSFTRQRTTPSKCLFCGGTPHGATNRRKRALTSTPHHCRFE